MATTEIPTELIERALVLTGKTMEDMQNITPDSSNWGFSIEKFCYYLLSPSFIAKYSEEVERCIQYKGYRLGVMIGIYEGNLSTPTMRTSFL